MTSSTNNTQSTPARLWLYHLISIVVILIWGTTFVSSKVLLNHGLQAHEIFLVRFIMAYVCIWTISPRQLFARSLRDEMLMVLLGVTGGSLYFVTENVAVSIGYVNNVSFIVCTAPLLTTILALALVKEVKATRGLLLGSVLAVVGLALVVFNGHLYLKLDPMGDALAFAAALCWAFYSLLLRKVSGYNSVLVTRKVFFYGIVTVLPWYLLWEWKFPMSGFLDPAVMGNILFLGLIASFACYALWSYTSKKLGALTVSNYVYLNPVSTVVTSAIVLGNGMTWLAVLGSALILLGLYLANRSDA